MEKLSRLGGAWVVPSVTAWRTAAGLSVHEPRSQFAPWYGEGHNSGMPLNITASLAVEKIMERAKLPGTFKRWPGIAE